MDYDENDPSTLKTSATSYHDALFQYLYLSTEILKKDISEFVVPLEK